MAAAVIGLIGAGVSAYSQHQQGEAERDQANEQAAISRLEGVNAANLAATQEATQRRATMDFLGRQAAAIGQSGIGNTGSALDVQRQSAVNAELDALNIRYHGQLTKFGYDYNADSSIREGRARAINGNLAAGATLLKGVSNYYSPRT